MPSLNPTSTKYKLVEGTLTWPTGRMRKDENAKMVPQEACRPATEAEKDLITTMIELERSLATMGEKLKKATAKVTAQESLSEDA